MGKRILIIDDDEDILTILNFIFQEDGFDTIVFNGGITVEQIKNLNPDLIILDIRIAGYEKSGPEICVEIKKQQDLTNIPVLLLSAELNIASLADKCGADGYIPKPFNIDKLVSRVKEFIF
ncbi:response regulator [Daejeonella lutea]|uniref:Response regulator receiver domain-containing protein n=1 Tax=Daejeonella lutea TaxID=572036 RepID=A0A1T5AY83_9SPHI|nr:response regulator [Daejeonella lutea]SKB39942.1 Response regulator receiver domain-containing protein [Daejeonella lutea]